MKRKLVVGITKDDEIYIVEIENGGQSYNNPPGHFSVCGHTVKPVSEKSAKNYSRQYWIDFFEDNEEVGKMFVRFPKKISQCIQVGYIPAEACAQIVLDEDGELHGFDNSLEPMEFIVDRKIYLLESGACGQHDAFNDMKVGRILLIPKSLKDWIVLHWEKDHLKKPLKDTKILDDFQQDFEVVLKNVAIELIKEGKEQKY